MTKRDATVVEMLDKAEDLRVKGNAHFAVGLAGGHCPVGHRANAIPAFPSSGVADLPCMARGELMHGGGVCLAAGVCAAWGVRVVLGMCVVWGGGRQQAGRFEDAANYYDTSLQLIAILVQRSKFHEYSPYIARMVTVRVVRACCMLHAAYCMSHAPVPVRVPMVMVMAWLLRRVRRSRPPAWPT